jgi:hypothetical protein
MNVQDSAVRRFRRHLALLFFLKHLLPLATDWAFVWGIAVLILRAAAGVERLPLLWGLLGIAGCVAAAIVLARRRLPTLGAVRALLDEQSGCGGLLMAGVERDLGGWRQKMPALTQPRVHWDGQRSWTLLFIAAGFVLVCFLVPQKLADLSSGSPLAIENEVTRLVEQIALLKAEAILDPERADTLKEKLAELSERSSGKDPAKTLEALDHLRDLAGKTAREAAEKRTRQSERLGEAEAMTELLRKGAGLLAPKLRKETLGELANLLDKSGLDVKQLAKHVDPQLMKAVADKMLDPEQLKKLAEALRDSKLDLSRQVEKMRKAGLIDADLLEKCRKAGAFDSDALQAFVKVNKGKPSLADLKRWCKTGGRGGIEKGSGKSALTWRKPISEDGFKFKEEILPPGGLASLQSTQTNSPANKPPQLVIHDQPPGPTASGALRGATAGSGSANTDVLLPRHRAAVERYFERQSAPKK